MLVKLTCCTALALLVFPAVSAAQCAAGIPSGGNPMCVPPDVYYGGGDGVSQDAGVPPARWKKRWGATAYDEKTGVFAAVRSATSKKKAQKAALDACRENGGSQSCVSWATYYNQCVSVAESVDGVLTSTTGPTLEVTAERALKNCSEKGEACSIKYTDCSYPARVMQ